MISFESLRAPKPSAITVVWEGQDLHVTYDRAAFTIEMTEGIYAMPIKQRMARVMMGWDLLKDGQPWQPADDLPADERAEAWDAILLQLPRAFVRAVDTGILDDFLGVSWRGATSANGSAPPVASAGSLGGTHT